MQPVEVEKYGLGGNVPLSKERKDPS